MPVNKSQPFRWDRRRRKAALLLAEDDLSDVEIARQLGVSRFAIYDWKQHPEFAAEVGDHIGQLQAAMLRYVVAKKRHRMKVLNGLHEKLLTVIDERATDYAEKAESGEEIPAGGGTGLVVKQYKQLGSGRDATIIEEFAVDVATVKEIRAVEEQAAKELGQWVEKVQTEDLTRIFEVVGVPEDAI